MKNTFQNIKEIFQSMHLHFTENAKKNYTGKDVQEILKKYIFSGEKEAAAVEEKGMSMQLGIYSEQVKRRFNEMDKHRFSLRFWKKDPTLWKRPVGSQEMENSMGWLNVTEEMKDRVVEIENFSKKIRESGFKRVVLLGMGGSSLAPYVLGKIFPLTANGLMLHVLDTTHPKSIEDLEYSIPLEYTLFLVSSKSGSTAEINALFDYFYAKVKKIKGKKAGENFAAITDPGTYLFKMSKKLKFAHTFVNFEDIGGRYSVLSYFGLVPASLMGIDIEEFLDRASVMVGRSTPDVPIFQNPGMKLGATIAELAMHGKNKLSFISSESLSSFVLWVEQLVAESTGKEGKGILPIEGNAYDRIENYGSDRVFINFQLITENNPRYLQKIQELVEAGFPVINIYLNDIYDLGAEFYRWEIATATAGAILGINPFDQPNVQENKIVTENLLKKLEQSGKINFDQSVIKEEGLNYYTNLHTLKGDLVLVDFLAKVHAGDYISIQAYLPEEPLLKQLLNEIKNLLEKWLQVPVTMGFGPRFLHSTGQYHKGGPNNGLFLQITAPIIEDINIPGRNYGFGELITAQALGDYETLVKHNRKVLKIELNNISMIESLKLLKKRIEDAQTEHLMNLNHTE